MRLIGFYLAFLKRYGPKLQSAGVALGSHLAAYYRTCGLVAGGPASDGRCFVQLRPNEILRLTRHSCVQQFEVIRGVAWVTETPATRDLLLDPGERVRLAASWPVIVQALEESELILYRNLPATGA